MEFVRTFFQSPAITLTQAEFLLFAIGFAIFLHHQTRSWSRMLDTKNEIMEKQHQELENRRESIESMQKKMAQQDRLIEELSSAAVIHKVVFDIKEHTAHKKRNISKAN